MPKIVDHDEQRRVIAGHVFQWIADYGIHTLSQRNVAKVSGRSKGNVQHYFPDKNSLILGALKHVTVRRLEREKRYLNQEDPLMVLRRRMFDVLPLDKTRANEWRVRLALYLYATRDAPMARYLDKYAKEVFRRGVEDIRRCQAEGRIRKDLDPGTTFQRLQNIVSGIAVANLVNGEVLRPRDQRKTLEAEFASIEV